MESGLNDERTYKMKVRFGSNPHAIWRISVAIQRNIRLTHNILGIVPGPLFHIIDFILLREEVLEDVCEQLGWAAGLDC